MEIFLQPPFEEVIFGSADKKRSKQIAKLRKKGVIRKIAPRIYTSNLKSSDEEIIRRNIFNILDNLYPGAVISHRSALEFCPTKAGHFFITYKYTKKITYPGLTLRLLEGAGPLKGDNSFIGKVYVSQRARAFLENLQLSKRPGATSKTLLLPELEEKLEQIIRVNGEDELNKVREKARIIAAKLDMQREFVLLNKLISALLSTHSHGILVSPVATARATGLPFDPDRIALFEKLFIALRTQEFKLRPDKNEFKYAYRNFAFFESYFSNYIEGTVFEVDEAKQIISTNRPLPTRPDDSHDVLGTYKIVSDRDEMSKTPKTATEFIALLQQRHARLLQSRKEKNPGVFKTQNNFAGRTAFVDYRLVRGTLTKSFDYYRALTQPFARAAYIMFVVSEVHPFLDGNGRLSRVMMNAELVAKGDSKIIVPTVFRDDYMGVLRKLTRQRKVEPYLKMLQRAHQFSATIYHLDINEMQEQLENSNAFLEHTEGKLKIIEREE